MSTKKTLTLITPADVAQIEGVNRKTVYDWINNGSIYPVYEYGVDKKGRLIGHPYLINIPKYQQKQG